MPAKMPEKQKVWIKSPNIRLLSPSCQIALQCCRRLLLWTVLEAKMNTYEYHELHNEESNTATPINERNITLVWVDEEAMMGLASLTSRAEQTIHMFKEINGDQYVLYNNTDQFLIEIEHLSKRADLMIITSGTFADVIIRNLNELSLSKYVLSIVIFCASSQRDSCKRFFHNRKVSEICTNQSALKAAIVNEKNSSSNIVICDRHLKSLFNLQREFEVYSWYKKYVELLTDDCESGNRREKMLDLCTAWYETNGVQMVQIKDFYTNYKPENAARWYAKDCFVYRVVNQALRTLDIETINAFRFYIRDLSKQLEELYELQKRDRTEESLKVYRGYANMTTLELDKIRQNIGGLISFNGFTSTTHDFEIALGFAVSKPTHESVIFQILANYNLKNISFADVTQYSEYHENEIIFNLCSVFRITNVVRNENNRVSIIEMTATDEDAQNFQNCIEKKVEVIINNKENRLQRCINRFSRCRCIILGSTVICLIIASVAAAILSRSIPSKHQISSLYDCQGTNCTTSSTSTASTSQVASPLPCPIPTVNAKWNQLSFIFVNPAGQCRSNETGLCNPRDLFIDDNNHNLYVVDTGNNRIQKYSLTQSFEENQGARGVTVASNGLITPQSIFVDSKSENMYILDHTSIVTDLTYTSAYRVQLWHKNDKVGRTLLSELGEYGFGMMEAYLTLDKRMNIYVGTRNCIRKWLSSTNYTRRIIVAGKCEHSGKQPSDLSDPRAFDVDENFTLYIADWGNHRVQKWLVNATEGSTLADGLDYVCGVTVGCDNMIYFADTIGIYQFNPITNERRTVIEDKDRFRSVKQFQPSVMKFDQFGNIFTIQRIYHQVTKISIL